MAWAEKLVTLSKPVPGGLTKLTELENLRVVWKVTGVKPTPLVELGSPPEELLYLWKWLRDFAHPMSFSELDSWCRLHNRKLSYWEVDALMLLDRVRSE